MLSDTDCLIHIMHLLGVQFTDNEEKFHSRKPCSAEEIFNKCELVKSIWFLDQNSAQDLLSTLLSKAHVQ